MYYNSKYLSELIKSYSYHKVIDIKKLDICGINIDEAINVIDKYIENIFFLLYVKSKGVVIFEDFSEIYFKICNKYDNGKLIKDNISEEEIVVLDLIGAFIEWGTIEFLGKDYYDSPEYY